MSIIERFKKLFETDSPVKNVHPDFNIYDGPWAYNTSKQIRPVAKLRFGFNNPQALDSLKDLGWIAKLGLNDDDFAREHEIRYGTEYIGFVYGDKENANLLTTWAQERMREGLLPEQVEIYQNKDGQIVVMPDGTSVDNIPPTHIALPQ